MLKEFKFVSDPKKLAMPVFTIQKVKKNQYGNSINQSITRKLILILYLTIETFPIHPKPFHAQTKAH